MEMAEAFEDHDDYDEEEDEDEDDDDMYNDYYDHQDLSEDPSEHQEPDPEAFAYTCVDMEGARGMLNEEVGVASRDLKVNTWPCYTSYKGCVSFQYFYPMW